MGARKIQPDDRQTTDRQTDWRRHIANMSSRSLKQSGNEIANVNFLYDDIVHVLQNTIDSCINSATDRRCYVLERMFTKFSEITQ